MKTPDEVRAELDRRIDAIDRRATIAIWVSIVTILMLIFITVCRGDLTPKAIEAVGNVTSEGAR